MKEKEKNNNLQYDKKFCQGVIDELKEKNKDHIENKELITQLLGLPKNTGINQILHEIIVLQNSYICKDKIRKKIKEWDESIKWNNADDHHYAIKILKDLLEEK